MMKECLSDGLMIWSVKMDWRLLVVMLDVMV